MDRAKMNTVHSLRRAQSNRSRFTVHGQKGLTLIEVLVALTILTIGLLGVALMQVISITGNTFSREMAVATGLGQDMLEKLRTLEYTDTALAGSASPGTDHPTTDDWNADWAPAADTDGNATTTKSCNSTTNLVDERGLWPTIAATFVPPTTTGSPLYIRTWNVINDSPAIDMKTIEVTVCWLEKGTSDRLVTISAVKVQE